MEASENLRLRTWPLALALIIACTAAPAGFRKPSLQFVDLDSNRRDIALNILLYVPLGLALARGGMGRAALQGALLSSGIELAQFFLPGRYPSPIDVASNTAGAVLGAMAGSLLMTQGKKWDFASVKAGPWTFALVSGAALILVGCRPARTDFSNWDSNFQLAIGDEIGGGRRWNGTVLRAAILPRCLDQTQIGRIAAEPQGSGSKGALPFPAAIEWSSVSSPLILKIGESREAMGAIKHSGSLSLLVWMRASNLEPTGPARILTYSHGPLQRNFTLGQQRAGLVFRLRTAATGPNGVEFAPEAAKVLSSGQETFVAATYDGRRSALYVNGRMEAERRMPNFRPLFRLPLEAMTRSMLSGTLVGIGLLWLMRKRGCSPLLVLSSGALLGACLSLASPGPMGHAAMGLFGSVCALAARQIQAEG